jgi:hypothetical protein
MKRQCGLSVVPAAGCAEPRRSGSTRLVDKEGSVMNRKYLGDSFDIVKRFWRDALNDWAPLYADPRFVPAELRSDFTALTRIPMLGENQRGGFSILNDPDTGIYAPTRHDQRTSVTHISLSYIQQQLQNPLAQCVVTFDQSKHRDKEESPSAQRGAKLCWLEERSIPAFFYVSHAPFLFSFRTPNDLEYAAGLLVGAGVPASRLEMTDQAS